MNENSERLEELISRIKTACENLEFKEHFWTVIAIRERFILNLYGYNEEFFNQLILISKKNNKANKNLIKFKSLNDICFSAANSIYKVNILDKGLPAISDILPPLNKSLIILNNPSNKEWKEIIEFFDYRIVIQKKLPRLKENINFCSVKKDASKLKKFGSDFETTINDIYNEYIKTFPKKIKRASILESLKYTFTMYLYHLAIDYDIHIYYPLKITDDSEIILVSTFKYKNFTNPQEFLVFFWKYIKVLSFCVHSQFYSIYLQEIMKHALRSAVAAIMIRNFSHHHGSHVLPRIQINATNAKDVQQYLLYLQEKTAFMNIIGVYDPICESKVNINDAINFFTKKNGNSGVLTFLKYFGEASGKKGVNVYNLNDSDTNQKEYYISPGYGELGKHALYIIFENYIRNLLKHCKSINSEDPNVFIKYILNENGLCINIEISTDNYFLITEKGKFCKKESAKAIFDSIQKIINEEELIHFDGKTNFDHPGLKEMRICANILMGKNPGLIEKGTLLPVLKTHTVSGNKYYSISYKFKVLKGKFISEENKENIEKLKNGEEVKPDFIVFDMKDENINLVFENWDLLPQRICWIGSEDNFNCPDNWNNWTNWIKKRSIFIQNEEWQNQKKIDEKNQYSFLLKKWYEKIFNKKEIEVKIHHENLKQYNYIFASASSSDCQKFHFYHSDTPCNCGENIVKLNFSTNSAYRIVRFLGMSYQKLNPPENIIIPLEIKFALGFKILIVDEEIFNIYNDLSDKDKKNLLKKLNIEFISENDLKKDYFKNYDCIVLHLGMLDIKKNLYENSPDSLPPYVRIVTGRARPLPQEILNKCLWAKNRLIDRSVFIRALELKDPFDIKYKIFKEVLS